LIFPLFLSVASGLLLGKKRNIPGFGGLLRQKQYHKEIIIKNNEFYFEGNSMHDAYEYA
jgi:hypothetical protein